MNPPPTAAVVVAYNSAGTIEAALKALRRCHDAGVARTIVVDNASTDGTREILQRHTDWLTVIDSGGNLGFGRGCNRGLKEVRERYVVFVNPDAELEPDACGTLGRFMDENPKAAMAGPAIVELSGHVQHVGGMTTPWSIIAAAGGFGHVAQRRRTPTVGAPPLRTDWLCGAVLMFRTEVLKSLGGFDPRFFLYFEETDLCRRALNAGHELWVVPSAVAKHVGGASSEREGSARVGGCIAEHYFQSRFYFLRKHFGVVAAIVTECGELSLLAVRVTGRWCRHRDVKDLTARFGWPMFRSTAAID